MTEALHGLLYGFSIALEAHNFLWCLAGVLLGNLIGVLPGMGPLSTIAMLMPFLFGMSPVAAILLLAGIFYGAQYGGAICSILINLPSHPPHAVTCLDGFAMTKQGRGGVALGLSILGAVFGAAFGIILMIFFAPALTKAAFLFGPADICALMALGLLAGSTLGKGSALKGVAMTLLGILLGSIGMDVNTGAQRFTFGFLQLSDGLDIVALSLGIFGIAEFLKNVNAIAPTNLAYARVRIRDMYLSRADMKEAALPILRGTLVGSVSSLVPGTGPIIASFLAYATEKKLSRHPERFGRGEIAGVVAPETATHASVQVDFIPTIGLGIPGDALMALLLGALIIVGVQPGPLLIREHPDIFWGLIASFWIGNIILVVLNVPLIGIWVKLLSVPYKYLYPAALVFICIGMYSTNTEIFDVGLGLVIGVAFYGMILLGFHPAPILLGFVLGPRVEENFRRAMLLSHGDLRVFVERPVSSVIVSLCALFILAHCVLWWRRRFRKRLIASPAVDPSNMPAETQHSAGELE